jgi:L-iditol 2-dehydrogenase
VPEGLDLATAALAEPAACCLAGLEMIRMPARATVLVIGGGVMGLLTLALARVRGAATTLVSDPMPARREAARRLGADVVVDPTTESLRDAVARLTGGRGVHVACEAVGKPELVAEAIALARPRGVVQLVGVCPVGQRIPADLFDIHWRELRLQGAFGRGSAFRRALALLPSLDVSALVTARLPLSAIGDAFEVAARGAGIKTTIAPGPP